MALRTTRTSQRPVAVTRCAPSCRPRARRSSARRRITPPCPGWLGMLLLFSRASHAAASPPDPLSDPALVEHVLLGALALEEHRPRNAIEPLQEALRAHPDAPWLRAHLAMALLESGAIQRARNILDPALRRTPEHPLLLLAASHLAERTGRIDQAIQWARRAARYLEEPGPTARLVAARLERLGAGAEADALRARWLESQQRAILRHLTARAPLAAWSAWARHPRPLPPWLRRRMAEALREAGAVERALLLAGDPPVLPPPGLLEAWIAGGYRVRAAYWLERHAPDEVPDGPGTAARWWLRLGFPMAAADTWTTWGEGRIPDDAFAVRCMLAAGRTKDALRTALHLLRTGAPLPWESAAVILGLQTPSLEEERTAAERGEAQ